MIILLLSGICLIIPYISFWIWLSWYFPADDFQEVTPFEKDYRF